MSKEVRYVNLKEFRAAEDGDEMILEGYAAVFDKPTVLYHDAYGAEYKEVISRTAFEKTDFSKCCLKYNHQDSIPVMSRVRGGSMEVKPDEYGLHFRSKLFKTQTSRDIYEIVREGGIDECSFAFTIAEGGDTYDKETRTRTVTDIAILWDCAVVDHPAYDEGTSVSARSFFEAEAEKERLESEEREMQEKAREEQISRINSLLEVQK